MISFVGNRFIKSIPMVIRIFPRHHRAIASSQTALRFRESFGEVLKDTSAPIAWNSFSSVKKWIPISSMEVLHSADCTGGTPTS